MAYSRHATTEAIELSVDQEAVAQRIYHQMKVTMDEELLEMARLMAAQPDHELLHRGEVALRDRALAAGAKVLEAAVNERSKKGVPRC
jgi:hypothetical protein